MRLALVISSLRPGGAEGVFARIANGLCRRGHDISLLTLDDGAEPPAYPLEPGIRHTPLGLAQASSGPLSALANNFQRLRVLRSAILACGPEAVLTFMDTTNILTLLAVGRSLPVVVSERVHPAHYDIGKSWRALRRLTYPRATAIAVQTADIPAALGAGLRPLCRVIPNPVEPPAEAALPPALERVPGPLALAMGRLAEQKGFDMLLAAFAAIAPMHPDWTLAILGEGPERPRLEALVAEIGLEARVLLPGRVNSPGGALRRGDLFVLSSRFEGFPNALCEAMASGLPAVAFDCPSGPGEIIRHGVDGLLVPPGDVAALSAALAELISDEARRKAMAGRAPDILERFGLEKVLDMWEDALMRAAKRGGKK